MKKIILDLAITLDGFIEGPNGEIDWCILEDDMEFEKFIESVDTIFYGRVSYDAWGNYQPQESADEVEKNIWKAVHSKDKFVFSSQQRNDTNAKFIASDLETKVREIKSQKGKDIWLYGGARLIKTFIALNLIDVYRLSVHPVALGAGKPLFEDIGDRVNLNLIEVNRFKSGVVQLVYHPK